MKRVAIVLAALAAVSSASGSAPRLRTVAETPEQVTLEVTAGPLVLTDGPEGAKIENGGAGALRAAGRPALPAVRALVAVPPGGVARLTLEPWQDAVVAAGPLARWAAPAEGEFDFPEPELPDPAEAWPASPARIAWQGRLRGQDVALVEFFPVRWQAASDQLIVAARLVATIRFGDASDSAARRAGPDPADVPELRALVVNPAAVTVASAPRSRAAPLAPAAAEGTWRDVKLLVDRTGLVAVSGADLTAVGVDLAGVDPQRLFVENRGAGVDIEILGESDGVFGPADVLLFRGEALDLRTTGTNVYWLRLGAVPGARIGQRGAPPQGAPTVTTFRNVVRREESRIYSGNSPADQAAEHWWWERLDTPANSTYPSSSEAYRVTLANLPPGAAPARLRLNLEGRSTQSPQPDHNTVLYVNGTQVDSRFFTGVVSVTHDVSFAASLLVEGENVVRLEQRQVPGVAFASLLSNWFSLEYDDSLVAEADRLEFRLDAGTSTAELTGFASPAVDVFDVTDPAHPVRLTGLQIVAQGAAWLARFQDATAGGRSYVAATAAGRIAPRQIVVDTPSSWRSPANGADFVAIVHPDFAAAAQRLLDRRAAGGLRTALVLIDDVMDEFADGIRDPAAIRELLRTAWTDWPPPAPRHVLLVGDANLDYRDHLGRGNDFVPAHLIQYAPNQIEFMSDNWYGRVDGDDPLPDMYVGRLPVRSAAEADALVTSLLAYDAAPPAASVSDAVVLVADDGSAQYTPYFEQAADAVAALVPPAMSAQKIYARSFPDNAAIRGEIHSRVSAGALLTYYLGHGNIELWGQKLGQSCCFWQNSDVATLAAGPALTFTVALNCINGYFADITRPWSLAEEWTRRGDRGAIASWSPAGLGQVNDYKILGDELFRQLFVEHESQLGRLVSRTLLQAVLVGGAGMDSLDEMVLFGDPALHLAADVDRDGVLDRVELGSLTDPDDADSDDDGLADGEEGSLATDSDGDGRIDALDPDADDDALPDGLESGRTVPGPGTDPAQGYFVADLDPTSTTDPRRLDSDGGGAPDGAEDADGNGRVDPGETDPRVGADDPACSGVRPGEATGLSIERSGADVVLRWQAPAGVDPCRLFRIYASRTSPFQPSLPDQFTDFVREAVTSRTEWRDAGAALEPEVVFYLVTAISPVAGEGPLGHYGF